MESIFQRSQTNTASCKFFLQLCLHSLKSSEVWLGGSTSIPAPTAGFWPPPAPHHYKIPKLTLHSHLRGLHAGWWIRPLPWLHAGHTHGMTLLPTHKNFSPKTWSELSCQYSLRTRKPSWLPASIYFPNPLSLHSTSCADTVRNVFLEKPCNLCTWTFFSFPALVVSGCAPWGQERM